MKNLSQSKAAAEWSHSLARLRATAPSPPARTWTARRLIASGDEQTTQGVGQGALSKRALPPASHEVRFRSLFNEGRALSFPCDAAGHVPMDELSDMARHNYLFARALVGRDFALPEVHACEPH